MPASNTNHATSLTIHAIGLIVLYSLYGILQEKILKSTYGATEERFTSSPLLVLCNRVFSMLVGLSIVLLKSFRRNVGHMSFLQRVTPASPIYAYLAVALLNFSSTFCQYEALKYVSFTTQALAKTVKMVPVLVMSSLVYKKSHKARQWVAAAIVVLGTFTYLTSTPERTSSTAAQPNHSAFDGIFGGLLLLGYLALDGLTSTTQEKVFGRNENPSAPFADGSPVLDQMLWVNLFSSFISLIGCTLSFSNTLHSFTLMLANPTLLGDVLLLSATSAVGLIVLLNTIAAFGALTSSTIMTVRQFLSILINAGLFGYLNTVGLQGWMGVFWVAGGIFVKMDKRFDEKKPSAAVMLPQSSQESLSEKQVLFDSDQRAADSSFEDLPETSTKVPVKPKKQYLKQYGPPLVVPIVCAMLLSAALPVFYGTSPSMWTSSQSSIPELTPLALEELANAAEEYIDETPEDVQVQIEGGQWANQLHSAFKPTCAAERTNTTFYPESIPYTALATYPRSGNTYIRSLIERSTGFRTSSCYCDPTLARTFLGECSRDPFLKKTHWPVNSVRASYINGPDHWTQFDRVVHLVRNPIDAIYSYLHYQRSGRSHEARIEIDQINSTDRNSIIRYATRWATHARYWDQVPLQTHQTRYEDLRTSPLPTLMSLLSFLLPADELPPLDSLACVVELNESAEAYHSRKSSAFSAWDNFSPDMRALIFELTGREWCRYGYDLLLKQELGFEPVDCNKLTVSATV